MADPLTWFGRAVMCIGMVLLTYGANWKVTLGMFLFGWGINLEHERRSK